MLLFFLNGKFQGYHKIILNFFIFLLLSEIVFAKNDTLDVQIKNIEVTSSRLLSDKYLQFAPLSLIDKNSINKISPIQISEVLTMSPGVFIKDYGGLGGLKTISIRGTSAAQTILMINGMRLSSTQSGTFDLSILPVGLINSIEVARSGMSAFYGTNAIGGAVNIITGNENKLDLSYKHGSFNENFISVSTSKLFGNLSLGGFAEYKNSDGNFPFNVNHYGINKQISRSNGEFKSLSTALTSKYFTNNFILDGIILLSHNLRGVPGAVLQGYIESASANLDETLIAGIINSSYTIDQYSAISTGISYKHNNYTYKDDSKIGLNGLPYNSNFIGNDISFSCKYDLKTSFTQQIGVELGFSDLSGAMLQPDAGVYVKRNAFAFNYRVEQDFKIIDFAELLFLAGTRLDAIQGFEPRISSIAAVINKFDSIPVNLKFQVSNNFRAPSFNEMYYLNYGTTDLSPELSISYNSSLNYFYKDIFDFEINLFIINTKDQIAAVPKSPVEWSAKNIGKVVTKGLELNAKFQAINNNLSLNLAYTLQSSTDKTENSVFYNKQVAYIPEETLNIFLNYKLYCFTLGSGMQYSSYRFSLSDNSYNSIMPDYYTLNCNMKYVFDLGEQILETIFEVHNVTDNSFEVIKNYPMPGRFFRFGINLKFKNSFESKK